MTQSRAILSWSGGKDSALALHAVNSAASFEITGLLTTVTSAYERISMHGVRTALLRAQGAALSLPVVEVRIPAPCSNETYEAELGERLAQLQATGVNDVIFGDLFLQDVRDYRERQLSSLGMTCHFPIWGSDTDALAEKFIALGFRAILVCVDPGQLDPSFCGRQFDRSLLKELPASCDPCGERGEFHTFVYEGPCFAHPVEFERGETVRRDEFVFCDLMPTTE